MREKRSWLLWLPLAALLLCACAAASEPQAPLPVEIETLVQASPVPTAEPIRLEAYAIADGVYDVLPLLQPEGRRLLHAGFSARDELTLLSTDPTASVLFLERLNLKSGERKLLFSEAPDAVSADPNMYLFYSQNPPLFYDMTTDELVLYAADGGGRVRIPASGYLFSAACPDGDGVVLFDETTKRLLRVGADGSEEVRFTSDYRFLFPEVRCFSPDGRYAYLFARDGYTREDITVMFDAKTGEALGQTQGNGYLLEGNEGFTTLTRVYEWGEDENRTTLAFRSSDSLTGGERTERTIERSDYFPTVYPEPDGFLLEDWDGPYTLLLADRTGTEVRRITVPLDRYLAMADTRREETEWRGADDLDAEAWMYPSTLADGYDGHSLLTRVAINEETVGMLLIDTAKMTAERLPAMTYAEALLGPLRSNEIDYSAYRTRLDKLYEQYGIEVLLGTDATLDVSTHVASPLSLEEAKPSIDEALDTIEATIEDFPPDFFRALCRDYLGGVVIELCGTIRAKDPTALDYPSALTCMLDNYRLLVFNVRYNSDLRYTLFHEIAHIIDGKLNRTATRGSLLWSESRWNALNPEDFTYYFAYNDPEGRPYDSYGSDAYTPSDKLYWQTTDTERLYFVNVYSKTYPTEDRAVLFGTLMRDSSRDEILRCPHILDKLRYYATAIRAYLDPDGTLWPDSTSWERRIAALSD